MLAFGIIGFLLISRGKKNNLGLTPNKNHAADTVQPWGGLYTIFGGSGTDYSYRLSRYMNFGVAFHAFVIITEVICQTV